MFHDWLVSLTSGDYTLHQYDLSLDPLLREQLSSVDSKVVVWSDYVVNQTATLPTLVSRHYIARHVLSEDIQPYSTFYPVYLIMRTFLYTNVRFATLENGHVWRGIRQESIRINALRRTRAWIYAQCFDLAMREDVTEYRLDRDHALLSSLSLLYTLHLVHVILTFEDTIHPNQGVKNILVALEQALAYLEGVLLYVEN